MQPDLSRIADALEAVDAAAKAFGLKRLAPELDKAYSTLAAELSGQPGYKLGVSTAALIMAKTGDVKPLTLLAEMMGHALIPVSCPCTRPESLLSAAAAVAKEFSEAAAALAHAMEAGEEREQTQALCAKELWDLVCAAAAAWAAMKGGKP
ncbi:MAG: phage regulatory CII family protein [Thermodesulfobacteriota bacterium]